MHVIAEDAPVPPALGRPIAAIGNFDGIHRGHQRLFAIAADEARRRGEPWGLVTFEPHPRSFFRPNEPVFRLTPLPLKLRLAQALGADFVRVLRFDAALASLGPDEFVRRELVDRLRVSQVVTGYDFHFGKGRKGSPDTMRELGRTYGFDVSVIEQVTDDDGFAPFASNAIRDELRHGRMSEAAHQLGYWWMIMGEVVRGDGRGRTIGFPTLNISIEPGAEPYQGIYAVRVRDAAISGAKPWAGAGYFGWRPTFGSERLFLEVFLLDFSGDLYGRTLMVELIGVIRPDRKFDSTLALTAQMREDCEAARRRLQALAQDDPMTAFPLGRMQAAGEI